MKSWRARAACLSADPDKFFLHRSRAAHISAKAVIAEYCEQCPVRLECLEEGLKETLGIWGGTTPKQRRTLRVNAQHNIRLMKQSD